MMGLAARICANMGKGFSAIASPKKGNGELVAVEGWDALVICFLVFDFHNARLIPIICGSSSVCAFRRRRVAPRGSPAKRTGYASARGRQPSPLRPKVRDQPAPILW